MKFLVVEDDADVLELIELLLHVHYNAEVATARDGFEALERVKSGPKFDLVFSDFNMPKMNGGKFFTELRKSHPDLPFVLVSSENLDRHPEFRGGKKIKQIDKPFTEKALSEAVNSFLNMPPPTPQPKESDLTIEASNQSFVPVPIALLFKMKKIEVALFLKISENKFVKVLHENLEFTAAEKDRFQNKNILELFVDRFEFEPFISHYRKKVFSQVAWNELNEKQSAEILSLDLDLVNKASKVFGWSPAVVALAQENIQRTLSLMEKNPDFRKVKELFKTQNHLKLATHSVLLIYLLTNCVKVLKWASDMTTEKLTFAALLHDIELEEKDYEVKMALLKSPRPINFQESDSLLFEVEGVQAKAVDMERIFSHPIKAGQLVQRWSSCPPDVDQVIRQHHERPDGSGFPLGLQGSKISSLTALFIVCEDLIYQWTENSQLDPIQYLRHKASDYQREPFRSISEGIIKTLESSVSN